MKRHCASLWLIVGLMSCAGLTTAEADVGLTITLDRPAHFTAPDGSDVQLPSTSYRIEQAGESSLRLVKEGAQPIEIQATKIAHDASVTSPAVIAVMEEGQDDTLHLLLVMADGQALDATGSFSDVRSRAMLSVLRPVQVQSAVNQFLATPQPSTHSPQQGVSPNAIVRVPQVSAGRVTPPAPVSKTVSKSSTLVTWDYLRMHQPELVADAIRNVQAGKQDPQTLAGLASPARLSTLLKQNYASVSSTVQPASGGTSNRWAEILTPNISAQLASSGGMAALKSSPSRVSTEAKSIIVKHIPPPDYTPSQLNLGSTYSDHPITGTIRVVAPIDSSATAVFPNDGKPFRVLKARTLTGRMVSVPYVLPSGQTTQALVTRYEEAASSTKPPFTLPVQSGQKIEYQVAFEPHMELFSNGNQVGQYSSALQVTSDWGWSASIPVTADFRGIAIGVIGTIDDSDIQVVYDGTGCSQGLPGGGVKVFTVAVPASMTFINADQQARTVAVRAETVSTLQMQPFTVLLAPGERKQVPIPMTRNSCLPDGIEQTGTLKYSYAGVERQAALSVTMYPNYLHWYDYGTMGLCDYDWDIFANADGSTDLRWGFLNRNLYWMMMDFEFFLLGHPLGRGNLQEDPSESAEKQAHLPLGPGGFVKENWKTIVNASSPAQVNLRCHCWNC